MNKYYKESDLSAYEAIHEAQKIALGPFIFQASRSLVKLGILNKIEDAGDSGLTAKAISDDLGLPLYGVKVLLDMGLSAGVVWYDPEKKIYHLNKVGHFLINDEMTRVNMNFSHDVNYLGLSKLDEAITKQKAAGLTEFSKEHETIYPIISHLPEPAKTSWFEFDHFYSDNSFDRVLDKLFSYKPQKIVDIGCNTGKWAMKVLNYNKDVKMVLVDLPQLIAVAKANLEKAGLNDRVEFKEVDLLSQEIPEIDSADFVFMSQFLDCFSDDQIKMILSKVRKSCAGARLAILELFWDRQKHETASFVMNATSLYFTAMANGCSRFYSYNDFKEFLSAESFKIDEQMDQIAIGGHSLLVCSKA
ncbi:MAG: class I SAM-dependent methyltransferase [Bdellovibrionota bacterium]|nr:class I SAM-dependent methyltransferase [Bdellovibrionota bacterium]